MFKIISVAIICAVIIIYLKNTNSELSLLATVGSGIILIFLVFGYISDTFILINSIIDRTGINRELYVVIFKITAIGYIIEFASDAVLDFGLKSLADKLIFAGKILILSVSMPIIYAVFNLIQGILQ
ncbi:MAG: hypothetical protein J6C62_00435 [Clostridia bacterium]|nr:hypothetical protein [Clostridia bacterium]